MLRLQPPLLSRFGCGARREGVRYDRRGDSVARYVIPYNGALPVEAETVEAKEYGLNDFKGPGVKSLQPRFLEHFVGAGDVDTVDGAVIIFESIAEFVQIGGEVYNG